MGKRPRAEFLASNLPQLQNHIKRDPGSYKEEFLMQWRQWESGLKIFSFSPQEERVEFAELINFLSHVAGCYPKDTKAFPAQVADLLERHYTILASSMRKSMVQALILLRNKNVIESMTLMPLFFTLFRVPDKELRKLLHSHIVADIKNANSKAKNNRLNKVMQNFMYKMLHDSNDMAARKSLEVMIDLYRKNIWNDTKTVNVIAEACFSDKPKLVSTALHFFLGTNDAKKDEEEDGAGEAPDMNALKHKAQINKKKRKNEMDKVLAGIKRKERQKSRVEVFNFSALHLLNDPQGFAEKLFQRLKAATANTAFRFELRLQIMNLVTRLIGVHKLILLPFYDFVLPYLKHSQKDVTSILAFVAQASHDLVPPDSLGIVVQAIADNFVWSNAASEVVTAGLNSLREVCIRCPLAMPEELLKSLMEDYKNNRDKSSMMAGRSLLGLFRELNPLLLRKKDRGKSASININDFKAPQYGAVEVADTVSGAEYLLDAERENEEEAENGEGGSVDPGEGWDGWEIASDSDDDEKKTKGSRKKKEAKAKVEVILEGDEEADDDDDDEGENGEGWEDLDNEDGDDGGEEDEDEEAEEEDADNGPKAKKLKPSKVSFSADTKPAAAGGSEVDEDENGDGDDMDDDEDDDDSVVDEDEGDDDDATGNANSGKHDVGPKEAKLRAQAIRRGQIEEVKVSNAAKAVGVNLAMERIFTDEDFAKMRELAAQKKAEKIVGVKRSQADDDSDADSDVDPTIVDVRTITAGKKGKMNYEERMEHIKAGREGREKYGSKMGKKKSEKNSSSTNREKSKKNKAFMMVVHKRTVQGKAKKSLREKSKVLRAHITKQKKKGH